MSSSSSFAGTNREVGLAPGLRISRIVTGLWQVADQERGGAALDPGAAAGAMAAYADAGLTTFDMADHYGSAEVIAGTFAAGRNDVQLLTKWVPEPGPASEDAVAAAIARALDRLGTDRIDLLQFHAWNYADPSWLDCLFMLAEHQAAGRIRHLGLTNCDAVHLDMAVRSGVPIVSNQVCFSLLDRRAAGAMTRVCRTHGVRLLAYGTLAGGFLGERWLGRAEPPIDESLTWSQMKYRRFIDQAGGWERFQALLRVVDGVARRTRITGDPARADRHSAGQPTGVSIANVACRYVLEHPAVAGIIVGARLGETTTSTTISTCSASRSTMRPGTNSTPPAPNSTPSAATAATNTGVPPTSPPPATSATTSPRCRRPTRYTVPARPSTSPPARPGR